MVLSFSLLMFSIRNKWTVNNYRWNVDLTARAYRESETHGLMTWNKVSFLLGYW